MEDLQNFPPFVSKAKIWVYYTLSSNSLCKPLLYKTILLGREATYKEWACRRCFF
ncbi:hypothetical protein DB41_EY00100 [Neochlamydia sp. TUME1]|nr:hypothetical protein DB41_EY00100 [Neochlamydia sp. TUME1]